ncbi:Bifunctional protein TrpGD [Aquimixticola soesokkakensis]|uniref:Bifunctional protein TrpGD n=1 Tax=Aquimixticola soesokkakensis TaxID=1519096 RepID=A0A1Y5STP6_9RHOB|nr:glycosyl transferase family protein [Aquimixticola soesokkakensis]SLN44850.1 Bifunctional protein TrpGD [Aquimixticola soesokkakensis]
MTLAPFVRAMGRGPGRARSLTQEEAREAFSLILSGEADPHAVGALLMLMRYRGEVPAEIAGFVQALRDTLPEWTGPRPALDWPSYAAGRTRGLPWFLLSAKLVAKAGHPVLIHGWNSHQDVSASVREALPFAGITQARSLMEAAHLLDMHNIAYLPLECISERALELVKLREVFQLRSCVNTVLRVMNPAQAEAAVQGVFHPPYRELQAETGKLLGQKNLTIIKGGGGEFERHPAKDIALYGLRGGVDWMPTHPPLLEETRRLAEDDHPREALADLWSGKLADPFAQAVVIGTAALALDTLGVSEPLAVARVLWEGRA